MTAIGIHDIAIATGHHVLELDDLAVQLGVDPANNHVGIVRDGFGSVGEMLTGIVRPDYRQHRRDGSVPAALDARVPLTVAEYRALHATGAATSEDVERPRVTAAPYRFAGVRGGARRYEATRP